MTRFANQVVLVTGGASGIGKSIVERFLREGAQVAVGDLDPSSLDLLKSEYPSILTQQTDVTSEGDLETLCARTISEFGHLHIAIANAGRGHYSPIVDHDLESWRAILDVCLTGVFLTIKHVGRVMQDQGAIVTIASLNAVQPSAGMSAYCAAKAGVAMLTQVAAMELGARGIRVNCVAPGLVETPATNPFFATPGVVESFMENTTLGRFAQPSDVSALVTFLASSEANFISGSLHMVDGGATTGRYPNLPKLFSGG
jgi:3-oxoacyl-[acyl-carrier protein] reductase